MFQLKRIEENGDTLGKLHVFSQLSFESVLSIPDMRLVLLSDIYVYFNLAGVESSTISVKYITRIRYALSFYVMFL